MSAAPIRARLGDDYQQQLDRACANTSAALRSYLLLGFAASGVDMASWRREIARCLAEDLAPEVRAALARIEGQPAAPAWTAPPEELLLVTDEADGDPLLSIGIDV